MNTRLKQFIAAENITQAQFADNINVVRASVSHILAGRNKPGYEFISGLMRYYPNLNIEWLMFGKGKMYKDQASEPVQTHPEPVSPARSGYTDLFGDCEETSDGFTAEADIEPVRETCIPVQPQTPSVTGVTLSDIKTLIDMSQKPVNQRKLVKITAFFDDGTFQELTTV